MRSKRRFNIGNNGKYAIIGSFGILLVVISAVLIAPFIIAGTTIYNRPAAEVVDWELRIIDSYGADITDVFEQAIISDTVRFEVTFTDGFDTIHAVLLNVEGISDDASPGGVWALTNDVGTDIKLWYIDFDTTVLLNGEYDFTFYYTQEQPSTTYGGDPEIVDIAFSSFLFEWEDGQGFLSAIGIDFMTVILILFIMAVAFGSITVALLKGKKSRKR